jgi:uncharacterized lipoprotein YddW (UPF0748 family)
MLLVHRGKKNPSMWEVAWTWLPYFLAADQLLHRHVDKEMTKRWKGVENPGLQEVRQMHRDVISFILERYPIEGLRDYLESISLVRVQDGEEPKPKQVETEEQQGLGIVNPQAALKAVEPREITQTIDPVILKTGGGS